MPGVLDILTARKHRRAEAGEVRRRRRRPRSRTSAPTSSTTARSSPWCSPTRSRRRTKPPAAVKVRYAEATPSATFGSQGLTQEDATKVSEQHRHLPQAGDAEAAIAGAEVSIDAEYATPTQHHNPIELFATTCVWTGDQLTDLRAEPVRLRTEEQRGAAAWHRRRTRSASSAPMSAARSAPRAR